MACKKAHFYGILLRKICGIQKLILYLHNKPLKLIVKAMKNLVDQINAQVAAFQANAAAQVEKNNKAAGTRARKAALELSKLLKEFRKVSVEEAKK